MPAQLTKDQRLVHHINTLTKINVKIDKCELPTLVAKITHKSFINHVLYQIQVTVLLQILSKHITSSQLSKIILWSTMKLLLAIVMSIIFSPLKTLPRSSKSCDCLTVRVLKYLILTFLLYTPHCHMILSKQKCCLLSTCRFFRESKSYLCASLKAEFFSNKKYDSYRCWSCAGAMWSFYFPHGKHICAIWWHVYQQIMGIPMGTYCAPLIADLFLYCYERDFMSDLHKFKRQDLEFIDTFNDTSLDILTIYSPSITLNLKNIFPIYIKQNFN